MPSQTGTLRAVRLAKHAGASRLAAHLYELEQGAVASLLPFYHGNEELLLVLAGMPTLRRGREDERTLAPGEARVLPRRTRRQPPDP